MGEDETEALWHALGAAREALILHYAHLVREVAGDVARRFQPSVDEHDLVSCGMYGLLVALDTFVPGLHGTRFEEYAIPQIEAAILEELEQD
jgi:RNA polymerase sigma factor for flagellar operon FliA